MKTDRSFFEWASVGVSFAGGIIMAVSTAATMTVLDFCVCFVLSAMFIGYGLKKLFGDSEDADDSEIDNDVEIE